MPLEADIFLYFVNKTEITKWTIVPLHPGEHEIIK